MKRSPLIRKTPLRSSTLRIEPDAAKLTVKVRKLKKCCICKERPVANAMARVCSFDCALALAAQDRAKRERKSDRERKEAIKTKSDWIKDAQHAFNAYVRERDKDQLCICCGMPLCAGEVGGLYDCGHYRSVGSAPHLRFDENNAHAQRKKCNRYGAGRAVDYRIGLIKRIGLEAVETLESDNAPRKFAIDELKAIRATYRAKLRELKRAAG